MPNRKCTEEQIEKRRFWKAHIETWQAGGLSQSEYCRRHELKFHQFVYWRDKYFPADNGSVNIVELPLAKIFRCPSEESSTALKVSIGDRYKIEVLPGFDPVTFKEIVVSLGQL